MAYYFTLGGLPLPIPPSSLEIKTPSMNTTVTLINEGEINIPKNQGLLEISFEFLIPTFQKYPFATYQLDGFTGAAINPLLKIVAPLIEKLKSSSGGFLDSILPSIPDVDLNNPTSGGYTVGMMIPLIDAMKKNKLPIQFIVTRMNPKGHLLHSTNIKCLIEDFTYKEDAEEYGFDTMCSISLKEYKPYATKRIKLTNVLGDKPGSKKAEVKKTRDSSGKVKKSTVTTKDGETIVSASKKNGDNLAELAEANNKKMPEQVNLDKVSTSLDIDQKIDLNQYVTTTNVTTDPNGNIVLGGGAANNYSGDVVLDSGKSLEIESIGDTIILDGKNESYKSPSYYTPWKDR